MSANVSYNCNFLDRGLLLEALNYLEFEPISTSKKNDSDIIIGCNKLSKFGIYGNVKFHLNQQTKSYDLVMRDFSSKKIIQSLKLAYAKVAIDEALTRDAYSLEPTSDYAPSNKRTVICVGSKLI